jgi:DNA-directed RNA polymerase specialized sigma24 family protein
MPKKSRNVCARPLSRATEPGRAFVFFSLGKVRRLGDCLARREDGLQLIRLQPEVTNRLAQSLPQLYRFCFLMTADATKALEAFQNTVREAALLAARGQLPDDRLWAFHEARHQCLLAAEKDIQPEPAALPEENIGPDAAARVARLEPEQLAAWIAAAPEPQRSALAFFYLNEFSHREMQNLLDLKMNELAGLISHGRAQFQAWLNTITSGLPTT